MDETGESLPTKKEIAGITAGVCVLVGSWLAYMGFAYDPHPNRPDKLPVNPIERFNPDKKAKIISESYGGEARAASFLLRQTLADGTKVTVTKPVFVGELGIHDPGDQVIAGELEKPLP